MWIFLDDSFLSVVSHRTLKEKLLVRGRVKGDIEAVFGDVKITVTPSADYRYRAVIDRNVVATAMSYRARNIHYDNFKSSVKDTSRVPAYMKIWNEMSALQDARVIKHR